MKARLNLQSVCDVLSESSFVMYEFDLSIFATHATINFPLRVLRLWKFLSCPTKSYNAMQFFF